MGNEKKVYALTGEEQAALRDFQAQEVLAKANHADLLARLKESEEKVSLAAAQTQAFLIALTKLRNLSGEWRLDGNQLVQIRSQES